MNKMRNTPGLGLLLAVVYAVFLSACTTVGPDFEKPQPEVADEWLQSDSEQISTDPAIYKAVVEKL